MKNKLKENGINMSINKIIEDTKKYKKVITVNDMQIIESYTKVDDEIMKILQKTSWCNTI